MEENGIYWYDCFVTKLQKYGLLDSENDLRCTSLDLEGVMKRKVELGWGKIVPIVVTNNGIKYGEEVK